MRKIIFTKALVLTSFIGFGQINVINSTNGSLTITPQGIRGKLPSSTTEDVSNISIGANSLGSNISGTNNLAIGRNSLNSTSVSSFNTAVGMESMRYFNGENLAGNKFNTALGYLSLRGSLVPSQNTGNSNTAIGSYSLYKLSTGSENVSIGSASMESQISVDRSVGIGKATLRSNYGSKNTDNVAIGSFSMYNNEAASGNVALGTSSLPNQSFQNGNIAFFTRNTAIGYNSMRFNNSTSTLNGINNTAIGANSLEFNTTGYNNVVVGSFAGSAIESGFGNLILGCGAGGTLDISNKLYIDNSKTDSPLIKGDFSTNELKINSKLRVGGTGDTPTATLQVDGSAALTGKIPLTSSQNNFNVSGKSVIRVSGGSLVTLTGLAGGVDGMVVYIYTDGTDLNIVELSNLSSQGNQFQLSGGFPNNTMSFTGHGGAQFIYDAETGFWKLISFKL